jgi:transcriptional regulator with XRE-family HTH domain
VTSQDIVLIARQRAGLTQEQLASRSGHPRETIARWENGVREPSFASLQHVVEACGLDLVVSLSRLDRSFEEVITDQLEISPPARLKRLMPASAAREAVHALRWVARARTPAVVVNAVAEILQGGPQRFDTSHVDIVSADPVGMELEMRAAKLIAVDTAERWADTERREPWALPGGGTIVLVRDLPGTQGYADLKRNAKEIALIDDARVLVAHPRDLLRAAEASDRETSRARAPALRALISHPSAESS